MKTETVRVILGWTLFVGGLLMLTSGCANLEGTGAVGFEWSPNSVGVYHRTDESKNGGRASSKLNIADLSDLFLAYTEMMLDAEAAKTVADAGTDDNAG